MLPQNLCMIMKNCEILCLIVNFYYDLKQNKKASLSQGFFTKVGLLEYSSNKQKS